MNILDIRTERRTEIVDITPLVEKILDKDSGIALIYSPHTTTAIIINEAEPGLLDDILEFMERLVPYRGGYKHDRIDDNADSHIKTCILGNSVVIPVENGRLMLGTWQRILFLEFDGPRNRKVYVRVI